MLGVDNVWYRHGDDQAFRAQRIDGVGYCDYYRSVSKSRDDALPRTGTRAACSEHLGGGDNMVLSTVPMTDIVKFYDNTRLRRAPLSTMTKPTGGGTTVIQLPPVGLVRGLQLNISATVTGTPDAPNALGMASVIRSVRLVTNAAVDIYRTSGAGWLLAVNEMLNSGLQLGAGSNYNQGMSAVAQGTFRLDMYLPVAMNWRDPIGLFLLQNREISVNLEIEWEADTTVTGGATATYTASCVPRIEYFSIPPDPSLMPPLNLVHQITEESRVISGAGDVQIEPTPGQIYLAVAYGAYWAQSASASWSRFVERVGQSDTWMDENVSSMQTLNYLTRGRDLRAGTIFRDYMGSAGLDALMETDRDVFDTLNVTSWQHTITMTGAGTLRIVKRQLVRVGSN